ncbi:MAG: amino acid adenylation domain-containing protein, partial [Luteolibacter sp.]
PFDLANGPLFRLHLVKIATGRHELLFTAHHLVCDGWSFGMILAELAAAYNARKTGRLPKLPPAMSFAEYARLDSSPNSAAEDFWVEKFSNGAPVLELPTDRPRPPLKTYAGAMESITLDADCYAALKKASPKLGGTLFATLLSSFATLLHRLTGQDDLVIGVPAAGQKRVGRDELVGHCLNFLPLRLHADGNRPFREFATEVKEQVLEAYDYQDYTFGSLLQKLTLPRDTSRLPLVSVMFNIDKSGIDRIHMDGLKMDAETNPKQFVNFELFFNLVQTEDRLVVECEYNTDLHDSSTIRRWLHAFQQVIESTVTDGETSLASLPILGPDERMLTLETWNATERDFPRDATLHGLVSSAGTLSPSRMAVRCGVESLTYAEMESRSSALAARLQAAGVKRGDLVGVHLERSCDIVPSLLAILKCGGAYVPMDPAFPTERLGFMVEDAHMTVILSQTSIHLALPPSSAHVLLVDEPCGLLRTFTPVESSGEDTAYVIFTSGSTGRPKGVRIPHRAVVNFLNSMRREPGLTADDVLLSVTTLSFDISGLEIFLPLTTGAEVVIATRETTQDGQLLAKAITDHKITVLQATPATWRLLLEAEWKGKPELKVLVGGEAVPRDLVNRLAPLCGELWNVYGPTETTIWSTASRLEAGNGPVLIGRPIDNTQVYIVNSAMQPQPIGVAGELLIGGDGLAQGYHELPELTADRFIDSPFRQGMKVYRTGDLARWTADGSLECLGRMDHQVKVRGFRIELGEIETLLEQHPAIQQAVVTVHDGRLVGYLRDSHESLSGGTGIWQDQWDLLYQSAIDQTGGNQLDRLDSVIAGWAGASNIEEQVSEWIDTTIDRIKSHDPRRIFEIGCGTGQILARLAATSDCYWAADISKVAIDALEKSHPLAQVRLFHRPADDFSDIPESHFDTVIINSVAQYFPDAGYLERVLAGAARVLRPGGRIFLGDLQGKALLTAHHAEALLERAPSGTTAGQLRESVARRVAQETELSLDPAWFAFLKGFGSIETLLRRGKIANETTRFHYDVVLHKDPAPDRFAIPEPLEWKNLNLEQLEAILEGSNNDIHLTGIPDARLIPALAFQRALDAAPAEAPLPTLTTAPSHAVSAEALYAAGVNAGFKAHVRWHGDGTEGLLDVVFSRNAALPDWKDSPPPLPAGAYANTPHAAGPPSDELTPLLRRHLAARLPDYMIPSVFVTLDHFPLTPNGKVDRKALPAPSTTAVVEAPRHLVNPRNEAETKLLEIWKQVLGRNNIGVEDDIFELGGDSILIFQITTRATRAGLAVTPAQVFRLRHIAAIVAGTATVMEKPAAPSIIPVNRDAYRHKS